MLEWPWEGKVKCLAILGELRKLFLEFGVDVGAKISGLTPLSCGKLF